MYSYFINIQKTTKKKHTKTKTHIFRFFSLVSKQNATQKKPNKYKKRRKHKLKNILFALWVGKEDKIDAMGSIIMDVADVTVFA